MKNDETEEEKIQEELELEYIAQLSVAEKNTYEIATAHLGTSFDLPRSIGYLEWLKKRENP